MITRKDVEIIHEKLTNVIQFYLYLDDIKSRISTESEEIEHVEKDIAYLSTNAENEIRRIINHGGNCSCTGMGWDHSGVDNGDMRRKEDAQEPEETTAGLCG